MALVVGTDSYLLLADAEAYFVAHPNPNWTPASPANPDKEGALRRACMFLETLDYLGLPEDYDQALAFPRNWYDKYGQARTGTPQRLKDAQCELAAADLASPLNEAPVSGGELEGLKAGPVELQFGAAVGGEQKISDYIYGLLKDLLAVGALGNRMKAVRV